MKSAILFVCVAAILVTGWIDAAPADEAPEIVYAPAAEDGMVAIREVTLKPGADAAAFKRFVTAIE